MAATTKSRRRAVQARKESSARSEGTLRRVSLNAAAQQRHANVHRSGKRHGTAAAPSKHLPIAYAQSRVSERPRASWDEDAARLPAEAVDVTPSDLHIQHDPKIHYRAEVAGAESAASDSAIAEEEGSSRVARPDRSAAFVNSVAVQQQTSPQTSPALAAGAADEVADQAADEDAPVREKSEIAHPGAVKGLRQATSHVSSRTMPGATLSAPASVHPHVPSVEEEVLTPTILPAVQPVLYNRRGRLIMPPAMKGTHEILVHQNTMADSEGLARIQDEADLMRMRSSRLLVPVPQSAALRVDERLPVNRRFCRPWTEVFLATLARAHYARFHTPLQVNSAVRTVEFQERLIRTNGNAAPAEGLTASPHLTGQAVDLAKHGLSLTEIAWLRGYLMPLVQEGKIDVEEEFQQACFHISVYESYLPKRAPRRMIAEKNHHRAATLATAIR